MRLRTGRWLVTTLAVIVAASGTVSGLAVPAAAAADTTYTQQGVGFVPLTPARLLDTRLGVGSPKARVQAGGSVTVQVTGAGGVPANGVAAVAVNVTAVLPTSSGFVTVFPTGDALPVASNLNFTKGATVANQAIAKLGSQGQLTVYSSAVTDLLIDVAGYYPAAAEYVPLAPARLLDTRTGLGAPKARVPAGGTVELPVLGIGGVPGGGVTAVVLNVTAVVTSSAGYLTAYPSGQPRPKTSNLNYTAGGTVPALTIAGLGAGGSVSLYTSGNADLVADVMGYIPTGSDYSPLASPSRIVDTRIGLGAPKARLLAGGTLTVTVAGAGGVPGNQVSGAFLNVTAVNPAAAGYLTVYPTGSSRPTTSVLNYGAGMNRANSVLARLSPTGQVTIYSPSTTDVLVDVAGYTATPLTVTMTQPATTAVIPAATTTAVVPPTDLGAAGSISTSAEVPAPGGYVYLPPGGANGDGVLGRVTAVSTAVGISTADIVAVPLEEVFPSGHIEGTTNASDPLVGALAANSAPSTQTPAATTQAGALPISCKTGPSTGVSVKATVGMRVSVLADWGPGVRTHLRVTATAFLSFDGSVSLSAGASCSWSSTPPVALGAIGPFVASGTWDVGVTVSAEVRAGVAFTASTTDGFDWWAGQDPTRIDYQTKDVSWTTPDAVNTKVRFSTGPNVALKLAGVAGPYVGAAAFVELSVDQAATPWWAIDFGVEAKAGVKVDVLFIVRADYSLASATVFRVQIGNSASSYPGFGKWGKKISVGSSHACAVTSAGGVKCWGDNSAGQLGNGTNTSSRIPVQVTGLTSGVVAVSAGERFTCALTSAGAVKCWGLNVDGQLGNGTTNASNVPVQVKGLDFGVAHLGSIGGIGAYGACVITTGGAVKCWGAPDAGFPPQLPTTVSGLSSNVSDVGGTRMVLCAVTTAGAVKCAGDNEVGQLGNGTRTTIPSAIPPVQVTGLTSGATSVSGGNDTNCAVVSGGAAKCWGLNTEGELGIGTAAGLTLVPVQVKGLTSGVAQISAAYPTTCAVTLAGAAKCWGGNLSGQVGNGSTATTTTPSQVTGLTSGVTGISVGGTTTCATTTGGVKCWGSNSSGQLGNGSAASRSTVPVLVSGL